MGKWKFFGAEDPDDEKGKAKEPDDKKCQTDEEPGGKAKDKKAEEDDGASKYRREGAAHERARIQAIEEMGIMGHDKLVAAAKYETLMEPQDLAMAVHLEERKARQAVAANHADDAREVAGVPASAGIGSAADAEEKALINAMVQGAKAVGAQLRVVPGGK